MGDGAEDGPGPVLVATKLRPPAVRDQVVPRERLLERLRAGSGLALSLVACPAGYGKTTLLAAWHQAEAARRPVGWLTLDEDDDDPVVLWSYVIEALRRACPAISLPASPQLAGAASIVHMVLPRLVNELDDLGEVTLILDDFHRLSDGAARESLAWFIDHAPPAFQLVLSARTEPDLPLAALRAHGELLELRAGDLRFTPGEADAFLNGRLGLGLLPGEVDALVERLEGWPAGLYLTALSLRRAADRHGLVTELGASSRHLIDFLETEVLRAHDPPVQALMLRSSVLERLSGPVCDAVLEQQHSAPMLDALSHSNLFLIPGKQQEAGQVIAAAGRLGEPGGEALPAGFSSAGAGLTMLRACCPWGDVGAQLENGRRAAELEGPGSPWRPVACWAVGMGLYFRGEPGAADRWFAESAALAPASAHWAAGASSLAYRSLIAGELGRPEDQRMLAEGAADLVREHGTEKASGVVPLALGVSLAARGRPEKAGPLIGGGVSFLRSRGQPAEVAMALLHHGSVLRALGERERSQAAITEARAVIGSCPDPGILTGRLGTCGPSPRPGIRSADEELTGRELRVLQLLTSDLSERDIGQELYVSHNTVHSHVRSIYRKLGVSSRAHALQRTRELRLL